MTPLKPAQFLDTFGVCTHIIYTDSVEYANQAEVLSCLKQLGTVHVRDACPDPSNQGQSAYNYLAAAGIKFCMIMGGNLQASITRLEALDAAHPGSVALIEGPNEPNNNPGFTYNGLKGQAAAIAYQADMVAAVEAAPALKAISTVEPADYPVQAFAGTFDGLHVYPGGSNGPTSTIAADWNAQAVASPGKGAVMTEGGYYTGGKSDAATPAQQAELLLTMWFAFLAQGIARGVPAVRFYAYQLFDAYPDPANTNGEDHYGLFGLGFAPKPIVAVLANLRSIITAHETSFSNLVSLTITATGCTTLVIQNGQAHYLVLVWSPTAGKASVSWGAKAVNANVYDPFVGTGVVAAVGPATGWSGTIAANHPLVIAVATK